MKSKASNLRIHLLLVITLIALCFGLLALGPDQTAATERIFYLASLGATSFPTALPSPAPYGQINLACRTGWRYIEPVSPTVGATPDWTTVDTWQF